MGLVAVFVAMHQRARHRVARLDRGRARFSDLKAPLAPITPRALSLTLKQLVAGDLVGRELEARFPPVAIYGLTRRGRELAGVLR